MEETEGLDPLDMHGPNCACSSYGPGALCGLINSDEVRSCLGRLRTLSLKPPGDREQTGWDQSFLWKVASVLYGTGVFCLVCALWPVYEGQEEQGDVMGRPVARV